MDSKQQGPAVTPIKNDEPNPPHWSDSVRLFHPTDDRNWIQQQLNEAQDPVVIIADTILHTTKDNNTNITNSNKITATVHPSSLIHTCDHHFSRRRMALLFAPGVYPDLHFEIGYYVQLLGLGKHVSDVQFTLLQGRDNDDHCDNHNETSNNSTSNRSNCCMSSASMVDYKKKHRFVGPYIPALNKHMHKRGSKTDELVGTSLDSFWRGAENFTITSSTTTTGTKMTAAADI